MTHVFYSFLTLARTPNPGNPPNAYWDGMALYESNTRADVMTVLSGVRMDPAHSWQRTKLEALMEYVKQNDKKWIWAIGGWSDLTKTIQTH